MGESVLDDAVAHHVCLSVPDREAAAEWWRSLFGFEREFAFDIPHIKARGAFLRRGPMRIELFEIAGSKPVPEERWKPNTDLQTQGTKHVCFAVADVQSALEKLHAAGVRIVGVARGVGKPMIEESDPRLIEGRQPATAFFLSDPWGSLVEILGRHDFAP